MSDDRERAGDKTVAEILGMMRSLSNDFSNQAALLLKIEKDNSEQHLMVDRKIDTLLAAFPEGGLAAHRLTHERMIAADKSSANLRDGVAQNIITGGIWATILVVVYALWEYLKMRLK